MWEYTFRDVTKSFLTLCDPMDCSPPSSPVHAILQTRILEWVVNCFSGGIFPTQGWNLGLLKFKQILYLLSHQESCNIIQEVFKFLI